MADMIIYTVVTAPGGVDGRDTADKGGTLIFATFKKEEAVKHAGADPRLIIEPIVVDPDEVRKAIDAKLTPVERLFHRFEVKAEAAYRMIF